MLLVIRSSAPARVQQIAPSTLPQVKGGVPTWKSEYIEGRQRSHKGTAGGLAIQIAAAGDKETAADTSALSGGARRVRHHAALCMGCSGVMHDEMQRGEQQLHSLWCDCMNRAPSAGFWFQTCAGGTSTGAATFAFIQAIEQHGTRVRNLLHCSALPAFLLSCRSPCLHTTGAVGDAQRACASPG